MHLDLRGEECPAPTIKAVEAMKRLNSKETLVVVLDDPICAEDIPFQARLLGYLADTEETGAPEWTITLKSTLKQKKIE